MKCRTMVWTGVLAMTLGHGLSLANDPTVGHWRFEEGAFLSDSGPNALADLVHHDGTSTSPYTLPNDGPGAHFHNPVPLTGDTNEGAAQFDGDSGFLRLADEDNIADHFQFEAFTIEAYLNRASDTGSWTRQMIAGRFQSPSDERSWILHVDRQNNALDDIPQNLVLWLSDDGADMVQVGSGIVMESGRDYFTAVSFDPNDGINFFVKDLETGAIETASAANPLSDPLFDAGTRPLNIGSTFGDHHWDGLIDEMRISNAALSSDEFLIVPEPGAGALMLLGAWLVARRPGRGAAKRG